MGNKVKGVVGRHPVLAGMGMLIVVSAVVGGIVWAGLTAWLRDRAGAEFGDGVGHPVAWPRLAR